MMINNINTAISTHSTVQKKNDGLQQEDFLNMLMTQLRYQDPMDPDNTGDLTQQLATFNMMDQGAKTNEYLAQLIEMQKIENEQPKMQNLVNYIDKLVDVDTSRINLADGQAECNFFVPANVKSAQLTISNVHGEDVYQAILKDGLQAGKVNKFNWESQGNPGEYRLTLKTYDQFEQESYLMPQISGKVNMVTKIGDVPYLQIGDTLVSPQQIIAVKNL